MVKFWCSPWKERSLDQPATPPAFPWQLQPCAGFRQLAVPQRWEVSVSLNSLSSATPDAGNVAEDAGTDDAESGGAIRQPLRSSGVLPHMPKEILGERDTANHLPCDQYTEVYWFWKMQTVLAGTLYFGKLVQFIPLDNLHLSNIFRPIPCYCRSAS